VGWRERERARQQVGSCGGPWTGCLPYQFALASHQRLPGRQDAQCAAGSCVAAVVAFIGHPLVFGPHPVRARGKVTHRHGHRSVAGAFQRTSTGSSRADSFRPSAVTQLTCT